MEGLPAIGGAHIWECDLTVRALKSPDVMIGKIAVERELSLHAPGSGIAVHTSGIDQGLVDIPSSQAVKLYVMGDTLVKLPARITLARVRLETTLGKDLSQTVVLRLSK
ncbi:MAG: hypothetical protein IT210_16100 [Armatimonadetes bacterium]|nr:hypothetical protein [Armatimonadota bacterium]